MTRIDKPLRRRRGAKRLDTTDMRKVLHDRRTWNALGVVTAPEDGGSHFELVEDDDGSLIDILVEVELMPDQNEVSARLSGFAGGQGRGQWTIPAIGDEVIVAMPAGRLDFQPSIVGVLSSGGIPNGGGQGPAEGRTIIVNAEVLVHDGDGGAEPLVRKSEYDAFKAKFDGHRHAGALGGSGSAPALTSAPATDPAGLTPDPAPTITGTLVLKGA